MSGPEAVDRDVITEGRRLVASAARRGAVARLLGGVAVVVRSEAVERPALAREIKDVDLVIRARDRSAIVGLLLEIGYEPDKEFNAFQGRRRLLFYDRSHGRQLDVFVGEFAMCHVIPLKDRLDLDPETLPLAELVMTKLQIVKLNEKDRIDLHRLFLANDVGTGDDVGINADRIAEVCANDWGLTRTLMLNAERTQVALDGVNLQPLDRDLIAARIARVASAVNARRKSMRWQARALIGERVQWYEDPDEP